MGPPIEVLIPPRACVCTDSRLLGRVALGELRCVAMTFEMGSTMKIECEVCGRPFEAKRKDAKTCGATCRSNKRNQSSPPESGEYRTNSLVAATRAELEAAGKVDTMLGQLAISLAGRMSGTTTGLAALSRELRFVIEAAIGKRSPSGTEAEGDYIDELRKRRDAKKAV